MSRHLASSLILSFPLLVLGCGGTPGDQPDTAPVYGTVTMDGKPLPNVVVQFSPIEGQGRPSSGTTDENGYYELMYTPSVDGAMIGEHRVTITEIQEDDVEPELDAQGFVITNLPKVASDGSITKTVEPGSNEIDIELPAKQQQQQPAK